MDSKEASDRSNYEPPTTPPKKLKERAFKKHGEAIHQTLALARHLEKQQVIHELLRRIRKHMEAQRIIARDLLDEEQH